MAKITFTVDLDEGADVAQIAKLLTLHLADGAGILNQDGRNVHRVSPPPPTETQTQDAPPPPPTETQTQDVPPPPPTETQTQDAPPPPPDVPVDSKGTPWDPELHSEGKTLLADGTWRKRRTTKKKSAPAAATDSGKPAPPPPGAGSAMAPEELTYKVMIDKLKGAGLDYAAMNAMANQLGVDSVALLVSKPDLMRAMLDIAGLE